MYAIFLTQVSSGILPEPPLATALAVHLLTHSLLIADVGGYYGWNVAALVILAGCAGWLNFKGAVAAAKFVAVLAGVTFAITVILR